MVTETKTRKTVPLCGGAKAHIDLFTGEGLVTFTDLVDEEMGIEVSHIVAPGLSSSDDYCCGKGTRLNLHEHFVKNEDETVDADYIYTDSMGDRYLFKECFTYIGSDSVRRKVAKENVTTLEDGTLIYSTGTNTYIVEREISTNEGMKASAKLEGIRNLENYDNSNKQLEELKDKRDSYAEAIANFAFYNTETKEIHETGSKHEELMEFKSIVEAGNGCVVMNNDVISLKEKVDSLRNNRLSLQLQQKLLNNQNQDVAERRQLVYDLSYLNWRSYLYLRSIVNSADVEENLKVKSQQEMAQYGVYNSSGNSVGAIGNYADYSDIRDANGFVFSRSDLLTFKSCLRSQTAAVTYQTESGETATYTQETSILNQIASVDAQIEALLSGNNETTKQLELYFKQYAEANKEYEKNKLQMPINFVMSNSGVKGFNESGELVVVYGKMGNYVAIEYEPYFVGNETKYRISRLYDDKERYVTLSYNNKTNRLNEIIDCNGKRTTYTYANGIVRQVTYPNGENFRMVVTDGSITLSDDKSLQAEMSESENGDLQITLSTDVSSVSYGNTVKNTDYQEVFKYVFNYSTNADSTKTTTVTDNDDVKHYYVFNNDTQRLIGYYEEKNSLVVRAEKYEYVEAGGYKYHETHIANRSALYNAPYASFEFPSSEKTFNQKVYTMLNKLFSETTTKDEGGVRRIEEISYKYSQAEKLIKKSTTIAIITSNTSVQKNYVELYEYNSFGSLVKKESYVEGEQAKNGIDIEEHIYDKNGNEIRTVKYNSLDPSSKLYTETEYDENGKAVCQLDALGENKTYFEYENGSSTVLSEAYPNGSKLSYGYSKIDGNTAISMSNEEGEENSIQVLRTKGLATKVISGDSVYDYTYDYKSRVKSVSLNGVELMAGVYTDGETELQSVITEKGETVTTVTDLDGKVKSVVRSAGGSEKSITNSYNSKDMLLSTVDNANNISITTAYTYDDLDRVTKRERIRDNIVASKEEYSYDGVYGDLLQKVATNVTGVHTYSYTYSNDSKRRISQVSINNGETVVKPKVDCLGRNTGKTITVNGNTVVDDRISYLKKGSHATNIPLSIEFADKSKISYRYDNMGNIVKVFENGVLTVEYEYDKLGRLTRENNKGLSSTYVYRYDNQGNILSATTYSYTRKSNDELEDMEGTTLKFNYEGGKFVGLGDHIVTPMADGRCSVYKNNQITWNGKKMTGYGTHTYSYDASGRRISKDNVTFTYDVNGRLIEQSDGISFIYDHESLIGFKYNGSSYYYRRDILGNIMEIIDSTGASVVKYTYNAWGEVMISGTNISLGAINPYRYRGYYYDSGIGLYFLQTRYYDPQVGRFLSMDDVEYIDPETIGGVNLYAYCNNNPVMNVDPSGHFIITSLLIGLGVGAAVGFGGTMVADYVDDGEIFNGSIGVGDYLLNSLVSGLTGALIGGLIAAAPAIGGFLGSAFSAGSAVTAGGGAVAVASTAAQALGLAGLVAGIISFAKGSGPRPGHNQHEKQMWNEAKRIKNIKDKDLANRIHNKLHKYPYAENLNQLLDIIDDILCSFGK